MGAKLLYLLTILPQLLENLRLIKDGAWRNYLSGGMVFYGGLAGALAGATLAARFFHLSLERYLPVLIPSLPLAHGIGRLGCFAAGCCYGLPASWGITYTCSPFAPTGIPLIPVQLIEAGGEIGLCFLLLRLEKKGGAPVRLLGLYALLYAGMRFLLEFFRGDLARGALGGLSTSQWLSLALLPVGLWLLGKSPKGNQ